MLPAAKFKDLIAEKRQEKEGPPQQVLRTLLWDPYLFTGVALLVTIILRR